MAITTIDLTGQGRSVSLLPSAARTATPNTFYIQGTGRSTALAVVLAVSAVVTAPSVVVTVFGVDLSGNTWPILTSVAVLTTGTTVLKVSPGITPATNVAVADILPPTVGITVTHANGNSITYSLSAHVTN